MTGFGSGSIVSRQLSCEVHVRAVNGRYLDIRCHLPKEYLRLESDLRKLVADSFRRGNIDIFVQRFVASQESLNVEIEEKLARKWMRAYANLGKALALQPDLTLDKVVSVPQVIHFIEPIKISRYETGAVFRALNQALRRCDQERSREGHSTRKDLIIQLGILQKLTRDMMALRKKTQRDLMTQFRKRIETLGGVGVDEQRIAQEVVIYVDKMDIMEEVMRLREHVKQCQFLVFRSGAYGKKLDFYTQELLRETNTIGSKALRSNLTQLVVEAKTVIERIREQVQNIE